MMIYVCFILPILFLIVSSQSQPPDSGSYQQPPYSNNGGGQQQPSPEYVQNPSEALPSNFPVNQQPQPSYPSGPEQQPVPLPNPQPPFPGLEQIRPSYPFPGSEPPQPSNPNPQPSYPFPGSEPSQPSNPNPQPPFPVPGPDQPQPSNPNPQPPFPVPGPDQPPPYPPVSYPSPQLPGSFPNNVQQPVTYPNSQPVYPNSQVFQPSVNNPYQQPPRQPQPGPYPEPTQQQRQCTQGQEQERHGFIYVCKNGEWEAAFCTLKGDRVVRIQMESTHDDGNFVWECTQPQFGNIYLRVKGCSKDGRSVNVGGTMKAGRLLLKCVESEPGQISKQAIGCVGDDGQEALNSGTIIINRKPYRCSVSSDGNVRMEVISQNGGRGNQNQGQYPGSYSRF